jgi:hypothetical protein
MAGTAPIRATCCFWLLICSAALGQNPDTQRVRPDTPAAVASLPEAPAIQSSRTPATNQIKGEVFRAFETAVYSPATAPAGTGTGSAMRLNLGELYYQEKPAPESSTNVFAKYLSPAAAKQSRSFHPRSDGTLMSRATYAASSFVITRDDSGRKKLNTAYLLTVLTSAAAQSANRPYWRRSPSQPFSDFGSTIGNDAGMNVLHQFEPGFRGLMKNHAPRFLSNLGERLRNR